MDNREDTYCVIMAGGVGSRFWPVSTPDKPKQFLDFMGTGATLLQMTYNRFARYIPKENIYVSTNHNYRGIVTEQIADINPQNILTEPLRRNTAPCIAYATYRIKAINPNAVIVVTPSDHLILHEDVLGDTLNKGVNFARKHDALLTLGLKPTRPETGYGYIQINDDIEVEGVYKAKTFTEKPSRDLAEVFIDSGEFFWNSGIFIWQASAIYKAIQNYLPDITDSFDLGADLFATDAEQAFVNEEYKRLPNISIDFAIMEKAFNVYVLCAELGWADVGSWDSLYEIAPKDHCGNVAPPKTLLKSSENNIISTTTADKLVVVDDLNGYIVADSDTVLMICRKGDENRIRQIVTEVKEVYNNDI